MSEPKPKSDHIFVRVSPDLKAAFVAKCERIAPPSEVLRELVVAFIDGRLTIAPPPGKESLYNARTED